MLKKGDKVRKKRRYAWSPPKNTKIAYGITNENQEISSYYISLSVYSQNNQLIKSCYAATVTSLEKFEVRHHPLTNIFR